MVAVTVDEAVGSLTSVAYKGKNYVAYSYVIVNLRGIYF